MANLRGLSQSVNAYLANTGLLPLGQAYAVPVRDLDVPATAWLCPSRWPGQLGDSSYTYEPGKYQLAYMFEAEPLASLQRPVTALFIQAPWLELLLDRRPHHGFASAPHWTMTHLGQNAAYLDGSVMPRRDPFAGRQHDLPGPWGVTGSGD